MDAIKSFYIFLDIQDCKKLYDYANREYLYRPSEGWDLAALSATPKPNLDNEISASMLKRIDSIHVEKGCFEKVKEDKEKQDDAEGTVFDSLVGFFEEKVPLPKWILPVLEPGDFVKGEVSLDLNEDVAAEKIHIKFKGHAETNYRIYHRHGYYDDKGEEVYCNEKNVAWIKTGCKESGNTPLTSTLVPSSDKLLAGRHSFPFTFRVPEDARQSVPHLINKDSWGYWAFISYYIKITIDMGKMLKRGNVITYKGLWIERPFDIAEEPKNLDPVREVKVQSTGVFNNGKITVTTEIPSRAVIRGKNIPLKLHVENKCDTDINQIKARLVLKGNYRSKPKSWHGSHSIKINGDPVYEGPVPAGETKNLDLSVLFDFAEKSTDGNLVPAGSLEACQLIDTYYELCIKLKRKSLHRDVDISIPIYVGTFNSKE